MINIFILGKIKSPQTDLAMRKWCIVELDEDVFEKKGFFSDLMTCGASTNTDASERPTSLKLYCLILNMDNRELHFQSFEDP